MKDQNYIHIVNAYILKCVPRVLFAVLFVVFLGLPTLPEVTNDGRFSLVESIAYAAKVTSSEVGVCSREMSHNGCVTEDGDRFNAPFAGTYSISARERRGATNECQGNEDYHLYINGTKVGTSRDPASCESQGTKSTKQFGTVSLKDGSNKVEIVHAKQSSDGNAESVTAVFTFTAPDQVEAPQCDSFTATPNSLPVNGGDVTLDWTTSEADSVSISPGIGAVSQNGNTSVSITESATYTLTVENSAGSDSCSVDAVVADEPGTEAPTCTLDISPNTITSGDVATLSWTTKNADTVSIDRGIGTVATDGSHVVSPTTDTTYALTAIGAGGTVTCSDVVTVSTGNETDLSCEISADDNSVDTGTLVTLVWGTTGATEASIDQGIGDVTLLGSKNHSINNDTTFTLTATDGADTVTCDTTVSVNTGGGGGGGSSRPRCEFDASKTEIEAGEEITLSWDNTRTNDIIIEDSRGNILVDTEEDSEYFGEGIDEDEDSIEVRPTRDTIYKLTAFRGSRDDECKVDITIEDEVIVTETRSQEPFVASVSLSEVPYTGFDATDMFEVSLGVLVVTWLIGVVYVLFRKKPVLAFKAHAFSNVNGLEKTRK